MWKGWTQKQDDIIKREYADKGLKILAAEMGVETRRLRYRAKRLGVATRKTRAEFTAKAEASLEVIKERYEIDGPTKLAAKLGLSTYVVNARAVALGLTVHNRFTHRSHTVALENAMAARYEKEGPENLAKEFGVGKGTIYAKAAAMGLRSNIGNKRCARDRIKECKTCNVYYFNEWSDDMAYILGFIFADGWVYKDGSTVAVGIAEKDRAVVDFMKDRLEATANISIIKPRKDRLSKSRQNVARLSVGSRTMVKSLMSLGVNHNKTYRDDPFPEMPIECLPHFIRGYFDGDGCASYSPSKQYCSVGFVGTPLFLEGLRSFLIKHAKMSYRKMLIKESSKDSQWATLVWGAVKDVIRFYSYIYPTGEEFCLDRKKTVMDNYFARRIEKYGDIEE